MITLTQECTHLLVAQGVMCIYLSCVSLIPLLSFDDMFLGLQVLGLSSPLATGLILVSCCPGGPGEHSQLKSWWLFVIV